MIEGFAVDPRLGDPRTPEQRVAGEIQTLHRRLSALEAARTVIGAGTLTGTMIGGGTITGGNIAATTITAVHISAGSISAGSIQAGAIQATHISANAITAVHISANAITVGTIAAGAVIAGTIAAGAITSSTIAAGAILSTHIAAGAVTSDAIVSGAVTASKISVSTLDAVSASMGTLTAGKIQIGSAGAAKVAIGSAISTSSGNKDGVVGTDASNAITFWMDSATGNLQLKGTILTGSSGLGNISGQINGSTNIVANTIAGDRLVVATITATEIAASAITATHILANTITANKLNIATLSAITADIGAITAGTISGIAISSITMTASTITGGTILTAAAGNDRLQMTSAGLQKILADNTTVPIKLGTTDGLDLLAGTTDTPPADRRIRWLSGAAVVATIDGYTSGGGHIARLTSTSPDATDVSGITVITGNAGGSVSAVAQGGAESASVKIIDQAGDSDFMRTVGGPFSQKIALGSTVLTFSGASTSNQPNVAHELGVQPVAVFFTPRNVTYSCRLLSWDATNFVPEGFTTDGSTPSANVTYDWIAFC